MGRRLESQDIGAWILRCNPALFPEVRRLIETGGPVDNWRIVDNYRQRLIERGQRVYFYIGGNDRRTPPGIYGVGTIDGGPCGGRNSDGWAEATDRGRAGLFVPVDVHGLRRRCTRDQLRAAVPDLEMFRAPQMGNPIVVRPEEDAAILRLVGS